MARWLHSGRRRDVCAILAGEDECTAQSLKTKLARHYDERIDPDTFRGGLAALVDAGLVERREDGLADVYSLTETGETKLQTHVEWLADQVE